MKPIIALALALPLAMPGVAHAATAERKALPPWRTGARSRQ